jgi:hypothetical protein
MDLALRRHVRTAVSLSLRCDTHNLLVTRFSDRDLHARYTGTFPGHIAQARSQGLTGPIAPWAPYAPDVASDTQASDEEEDASDEDMQDEAELERLGEEPPPDDDQDVGDDEDGSIRQEGEGDEDGDQDDEDDDQDDAEGTSETVEPEGVQLDADGETYDDEDTGYAGL